MPNWAMCRLEITGHAVSVAALVAYVASDECPFSFDKIVPMPGILRGTELLEVTAVIDGVDIGKISWPHFAVEGSADAGFEECTKYRPATVKEYAALMDLGFFYWYDWRCKKWGTKWPAVAVGMDRPEPGCVIYQFMTAWAEPEPVIIALGRAFPTLNYDLHVAYDIDWGVVHYKWLAGDNNCLSSLDDMEVAPDYTYFHEVGEDLICEWREVVDGQA